MRTAGGKMVRVAKLAFAVALLAALLAHVGYRPIAEAFNALAWWWLPVLLGVRVVALYLQSQRWRLFLASHEIRASSLRLFKSYWVGRFFGSFSPGQLGGDAYRILYGLDPSAARTQVASSVVIERVSGLISLMLVVAAGGYAYFDVMRAAGLTFLPIAASVGAIALLIVATTRAPAGWAAAAARLLPGARLNAVVSGVLRALVVHVDQPKTLAVGVALGVAFYMVIAFESFLAFHALGVEIDPVLVAVVVPMIALISSLPITINGWGAAEATSFLLYTQLGIASPAALSIALLTRVSSTLMGGLGGLILCWDVHAQKFALSRQRVRADGT
jgi:uncharacterized protein (TIRG00374 family)